MERIEFKPLRMQIKKVRNAFPDPEIYSLPSNSRRTDEGYGNGMRRSVGALVTVREAGLGSASYYLCRRGHWSSIALWNISLKWKIMHLSQEPSYFWKFRVRWDNGISF